MLHYSYVGAQFVFGELARPGSSLGVIFAFQILPAIIFVSALFAIMYYLGIMQLVVRALAVVMSKLMKASGAESLDVAASIFMGQTEAPLTIRPFLPKMTRSELMTVMTAGMAHISGSIMAAYIAFGIEARHLLAAVIMTAPGTIMMAKMFEPETGTPETYGNVKLDMPQDRREPGRRGGARHQRGPPADAQRDRDAGVVHRAGGAGQRRLRVDPRPGRRGSPRTCRPSSGWVGRPIAWAMGVPWQDSGAIGSLLGTRTVLNEFIAFAPARARSRPRSIPRSFTIASFALAGFANFSSVGIQIGGIGALAPERKSDLARLGLPRHAGRHPGQLHVGDDRGDPAVTHGPARGERERRGGRRGRPRRLAGRTPTVAIVLGSGLGGLAERMTDAVRIPYAGHSRVSRADGGGPPGELVVGTLAGKTVLAQSGRFHMYEGHAAEVDGAAGRGSSRALGVTTLIVDQRRRRHPAELHAAAP